MLHELLLLSAMASAAIDCAALDARANAEGARIPGHDAGREVIGTGRLPFHSAPDPACAMRGVFVIPRDRLIAYAEFGEYTSVMYLNRESGNETLGWVRTERLRRTGTGIAPE